CSPSASVGEVTNTNGPVPVFTSICLPSIASVAPVIARLSVPEALTSKPGGTTALSFGEVHAIVGATGSGTPSLSRSKLTEFWFARHTEPLIPHCRLTLSPHDAA